MKRTLVPVIMETRKDEPERKFYLPSGFDRKIILLWEDLIDLEVRYISEKETPKEVLKLLGR